MKRIIAILLTVLMVLSLAACSINTHGKNPDGTDVTESQSDGKADITKYKKDFSGMQSYLVDMDLIDDSKDKKKETQADIIGAKKGVRYTLDASSFVEFYEFDTNATPDEAQKVYDDISNNGVYNVLDLEDMKGVVSNSGKFVMLYPANSKYDYSKIITEFKKF